VGCVPISQGKRGRRLFSQKKARKEGKSERRSPKTGIKEGEACLLLGKGRKGSITGWDWLPGDPGRTRIHSAKRGEEREMGPQG